MANARYPGPLPFTRQQEDLFLGRDAETILLDRKVRLYPMTVLYGKSGTGKSSLINAGLLPKLTADDTTDIIQIRFYPAGSEAAVSPLGRCRQILSPGSENAELAGLIREDDSIWRWIRGRELNSEGQQRLLLVFDQFEEIFTYPPAELLAFRTQLAEALFTALPQRYWEVLENTVEDQLNPLLQSNRLAVLFSVRSDRLHLLERLDDQLPNILRNCLEIHSLNLAESRLAITAPAALEGDFTGPPFTYSSEAIGLLLDFLTSYGQAAVETTQLQIVCSELERRSYEAGLQRIEAEHCHDLTGIIERYYAAGLEQITDPQQRHAARLLIEEALIFAEEERRLSLYRGRVLSMVDEATLDVLVGSHLIRAEPSIMGGFAYELSHDSLVAPILRARAVRRAEEKRIAEAARRAEINRERRKRRLAVLLAGLFFLLAVTAGYFAWRAKQEQRRASERYYVERMETARRLRGNGEYVAAVVTLEEMEGLAMENGREVAWRDSLARVRTVRDILAEPRPGGINGVPRAIDQYERALELAPDRYLRERLRAAEDSVRVFLQRKISAYEDLGGRNTGINQERREEILTDIRRVSPTVADSLQLLE